MAYIIQGKLFGRQMELGVFDSLDEAKDFMAGLEGRKPKDVERPWEIRVRGTHELVYQAL